MSTQTETKSLMQIQLEELIKVGVGGKFKDNNDYVEQVTKELEFEEAMLRGGMNRYNKTVTEEQTKH